MNSSTQPVKVSTETNCLPDVAGFAAGERVAATKHGTERIGVVTQLEHTAFGIFYRLDGGGILYCAAELKLANAQN